MEVLHRYRIQMDSYLRYRNKDTKIQRYKDTKIQRYKETKRQRYKETKIQRDKYVLEVGLNKLENPISISISISILTNTVHLFLSGQVRLTSSIFQLVLEINTMHSKLQSIIAVGSEEKHYPRT